MKKILMLTSLLIVTTATVLAQKQYKLNKTGGKLIINNISNLNVEGYDGKEIIFTVVNEKEDNSAFSKNENNSDDPRAKGLSALSNNGFDNTGLSLNISEKGNDVFVSPVGNLEESYLNIKIPNTVALSVKNGGWPVPGLSGEKSISLNKIKSEIDASVQFENFKLTDISGPLSIKTLNGNIELQLAKGFKGPISVYSVSGFIDMTIPEDTKADLSMRSVAGTIYADKNLKLEATPLKKAGKQLTTFDHGFVIDSAMATARNRVSALSLGKFNEDSGDGEINRVLSTAIFDLPYSNGSSSFDGTMNGGGQKIRLQTMSGKIYLRK